ncbi:RDD family protein [Chitinophagaceae bacterium MMS25-I14]
MEDTIPSVFDEIEQQASAEHATTGQRFVHLLIDTVVYYAASYVFGYILGYSLKIFGAENFLRWIIEGSDGVRIFNFFFGLFVYVITYTLIEGLTKGKTLGKVITRTRVVSEDGSPLSWKQAALRSVIRLVPFEGFSALNGFPWHDQWSRTKVIKERKRF